MTETVTGLELRNAVGSFPTGVTVVTTHSEGMDIGLTVSAFASLSLEPAMVVVCIESKSKSLPHLAVGREIGISVLASEQLELAVQFARHVEDRFDGVEIERRGKVGVPFIKGAVAWFLGVVDSWYEGGDHTIVTVAIQECHSDYEKSPIKYLRGSIISDSSL
ncbi:flavin reductase family protein [Corynebacterium sp. P7202]|uniref:Flavin reductase family protein n=1 Tax=Corynebacterium pygosceleis TaxID=2800406 RepID=A0A9Q4GIM7_9CORY|nr:flavin reductase family protein [Corynebacterium pygosceleis]MCK7637857.1 flavin reductase family protein [Corynebacterium pygosceleis]MCX7444603.1 flavin reductase family protein [Corynebacterium pygosceleis]MCX7468573.1 flavin reductase family protein [Corynebacterium pygosceleis]